jgi:hypothetical protein
MKCIITLHDPTDFLNIPGTDWTHANGDPRIFRETKKIWENVKDDETFSIFFWKQDPSLKDGEYTICRYSRTICIGSQYIGNYWQDDLKTVQALLTVIENNFNYDYILWTQLGTYWVLPKLKKFLEKGHEYTGVVNTQFPEVRYTSGAASIYSRNTVKLIVSHEGKFIDHKSHTREFGDDVYIGYFLNKRNVYPVPQYWYRWLESGDLNIEHILEHDDINNLLMYRVKSMWQRHLDPIILGKICKYYNIKYNT